MGKRSDDEHMQEVSVTEGNRIDDREITKKERGETQTNVKMNGKRKIAGTGNADVWNRAGETVARKYSFQT